MGRSPAVWGASRSAVVHDGIDFRAFATWWNKKVDAKETARDFTSGLFRKTPALLRMYHDQCKRSTASTVAGPVTEAAGAERRSVQAASFDLPLSLRGSSRYTGHELEPSRPQKRPLAPAVDLGQGHSIPAKRAHLLGGAAARPILPKPVLLTVFPTSPAPEAPAKRPNRPGQKHEGTRTDPRCKGCGRLKKSDPLSSGKHRKRVAKSSPGYCRVPVQYRRPGFPLAGYEVADISAKKMGTS